MIRVECYSGYRADERPMRFYLDDRPLDVLDVEDQWYSPSLKYFRVRASDGNIYVLCHDEDADSWDLSAFRLEGNSRFFNSL